MDNCGCGHDHDFKEGEFDAGHTLFSAIDRQNVHCLNERVANSSRCILRPWDQRLDTEHSLESAEGDVEMILHIPFDQRVQVKSFVLIPGPSGTAPDTVSIWVNRDDIDFSNANDIPTTQTVNLVEDHLGVVDYQLKPNKFSNVSSLTLFFSEEAVSGDKCQINFLTFKGKQTGFKRQAVIAVYESKPMMKDHKTKADSFVGQSLQ